MAKIKKILTVFLGNQLEIFVSKRTEYFKKNSVNSKSLCELLVVELLYVWVYFIYCEEVQLKKMLESMKNQPTSLVYYFL